MKNTAPVSIDYTTTLYKEDFSSSNHVKFQKSPDGITWSDTTDFTMPLTSDYLVASWSSPNGDTYLRTYKGNLLKLCAGASSASSVYAAGPFGATNGEITSGVVFDDGSGLFATNEQINGVKTSRFVSVSSGSTPTVTTYDAPFNDRWFLGNKSGSDNVYALATAGYGTNFGTSTDKGGTWSFSTNNFGQAGNPSPEAFIITDSGRMSLVAKLGSNRLLMYSANNGASWSTPTKTAATISGVAFLGGEKIGLFMVQAGKGTPAISLNGLQTFAYGTQIGSSPTAVCNFNNTYVSAFLNKYMYTSTDFKTWTYRSVSQNYNYCIFTTGRA